MRRVKHRKPASFPRMGISNRAGTMLPYQKWKIGRTKSIASNRMRSAGHKMRTVVDRVSEYVRTKPMSTHQRSMHAKRMYFQGHPKSLFDHRMWMKGMPKPLFDHRMSASEHPKTAAIRKMSDEDTVKRV